MLKKSFKIIAWILVVLHKRKASSKYLTKNYKQFRILKHVWCKNFAQNREASQAVFRLLSGLTS